MTEEVKTSRRERRAENAGAGAAAIKDKNQRLRAEAAQKRKGKGASAAAGLGAGERVDDALARSADRTGKFVRDHFRWLQWVVVVGLVGGMGYLVWNFRSGVDSEKQGHALGEALRASTGRLATDAPLTPSDSSLIDTREEFATAAARSQAKLDRYGALAGGALGALGKLGAASVLYDEGRYGEAHAAYEALISSKALEPHRELAERALEGAALSLEADGKLEEAKKALVSFGDASSGAKALADLHRARIDYRLGKVEDAKKLLEELVARLEKKLAPGEEPGYALAAAKDLQKTVDPSKAKAAAEAGNRITPEQLAELQRRIDEMQRSAPPAPAPDAPDGEFPFGQGPLAPEEPAGPDQASTSP